jgi:asparagine synthase (glutamine-hydrolysing)
MCGIAGVFFADSRPVAPDRLEAMSSAIVHRGPDGSGVFRAPGVGLVHRRLSIIDLEGGRQPLGNEDGSVQVVFNGEIYNYQELRQRLLARGHHFATNSDTEVLVHLYEEVGDRLVDQLRGMFAFALWDQRSSRLLLARDRLGIKPLYYLHDEEKLLFASELKGILAYGDVPRDVDPHSLEDYLAYGMVSGTRTIFRGIHKLAPAHSLTVDADHWESRPRRYWRLEFAPDTFCEETRWRQRVRAKLAESVEKHLIADVPVGAFLSGGIDSSVITALAAQRSQQPIQTFSIGFKDSANDELPFARQTAQRYGTRHVEEVVSADAVSLLDQLCWHYDEPLADSSAVPTMLVSRLAAQHVKVVLSGDGGDEAFGGYSRYVHDLREAAIRHRLPAWFRKRVLGPAARAWPQADWLPRWLRGKSVLTNLAADEADAYANTISTCRQPLRRQLLAHNLLQGLDGHRPERRIAEAYLEGVDPLSSMIAADVQSLLPDDYLVKVDRASMAFGLEVRPPLLDHELLELTATIPSSLKVRQGETKWIFKQACGDLLPPALLARKKQGFEAPVDAWLRGPLRELFHDVVLSGSSPAAQWLNLNTAREAFDQHRSGRRRLGQILWSLIVLARWSELFLGNSSIAKHDSQHETPLIGVLS